MSHRILYLASTFDRYTAASEMAAVACQLPKGELEVEVCALGLHGPVADDLCTAGIACHSFGRRWSADPIAQLQLVRHLRKTKPQLVHAWDSGAACYAANALRWARRPRLVVQKQLADVALFDWRSMVERRWMRSADMLLASSESIQKEAIAQGWPNAPWEIIPSGVSEPPSASTSRGDWLDEFSLPADAKLIGVAGPLLPRHGVKELIWAADMVRVLHPTVRLLIVGEGPERPHLERFACTAAEPENICFLGDRGDFAKILPHLDVYWQGNDPSARSTALLQAMAAGVPVVASDTPLHAEQIVDGESGYLVGAEARALRTRVTDRLFNDQDLAKAIGAAGKERVQSQFSLTQQVEQLAKAYRRMLVPGIGEA